MPLTIQIGNIIEMKSDFIISAAVTKFKEGSEFILFDPKGMILEISQTFFEQHI